MDDTIQMERMKNATTACFEQLRNLVDKHIVSDLEWYERHTNKPWFWFRTCGTLLIVLSISLPVLSSVQFPVWLPTWFPSKDSLVSLIALIIALLSGIGTFFHWHETWHANTRAKLELRHLFAMWEVRIVEAQLIPEPSCQAEAAIAATKELFDAAAKVDISNTEGYFKNVQFPEMKK